MSKVDFDSAWQTVPDGNRRGGSGGGRADFMKLVAGKYVVRLLGSPVRFFKFMNQGSDQRWRSAVVTDPDNNIVVKKHNLRATERYAINVIDRSDGQLKILEAGVSVFSEFRKVYDIVKRNIGGAVEGADFIIVVEGAGRGKKYTTKFDKNTPITDDETKYIKEHGLYDLSEIYKPVADNELEARLFGAEQAASSESAGDTSWGSSAGDNLTSDLTSQPASQPASGAEVNTDDLPF